ncbi:MAG TPA: integrin, partial [Verrucomicrobiales bacterium]|nr:integrin [Verrucomicrobiales bacterium]
VFVRNAGVWIQQAYLKASQPGFAHNFGAAVAVAGDTLLVGSPGEASSSSEINGDQLDQSA